MLADYIPWLRSVWTVWFFAVFAGLVISALLPRRRAQFEATARIPLDDDPHTFPRWRGKVPEGRMGVAVEDAGDISSFVDRLWPHEPPPSGATRHLPPPAGEGKRAKEGAAHHGR